MNEATPTDRNIETHPGSARSLYQALLDPAALEVCVNCHQVKNQEDPHMPPGTPYPLKGGVEDPAHRGEPRWHLPPAAMRMVVEKRSPGQLCSQLLDKKKNGRLTPEELVDHVNYDPFVLWAWNPDGGRSSPSLTHEEFVAKVREWISKGGACPK